MNEQNQLYPIFVKVHQLNVLLIGGGEVAEEKLTFLLKSSPDANVTLVSKGISAPVWRIIIAKGIPVIQSEFHARHLEGKSMVIAATNCSTTNQYIRRLCTKQKLLLNVADCPDLCDFYLGGIVSKGNLKVAISTNGKSPTMAKRLRQYFEDVIPDDIENSLQLLNEYRQRIQMDFKDKVNHLNDLTKQLLD